MTIEAAKRGYAFASVRPRGDRDFERKRINLIFVLEEGARAYIERINIRGNTRTRDYVIRREFDLGEGDAYNRALIDRAERRLKNLNYFKTVKITNEPGSAPDRVIINVDVEEQPTGEFSVSGGYSTSRRLPGRSQRRRPQLARQGQYAKASVSYGQYAARLRTSVSPSRICSATAWPAASTCLRRKVSRTVYVSYNTQTVGVHSAPWLCAVAKKSPLQPRYSLYQQKDLAAGLSE